MFETEIKTALKAAGLSEGLCDQITVKTSDEIAGAITQLKSDLDKAKGYTDAEFLAAVERRGLGDPLKRYLQSQTDKRVTEALKTHDEKIKKAAEDEAAKKKDDDSTGEKTMTDERREINALKDTITGLVEKLDGIETKLTTSDKTALILAALKDAGLDEKFAKYVTADDPDGITAAVANLKTDLDARAQADIDAKLESGALAAPKAGGAGQTAEEKDIAEYAKTRGVDGIVKNPDFPGKITSEKAAKTAEP